MLMTDLAGLVHPKVTCIPHSHTFTVIFVGNGGDLGLSRGTKIARVFSHTLTLLSLGTCWRIPQNFPRFRAAVEEMAFFVSGAVSRPIWMMVVTPMEGLNRERNRRN